MAVTAFKDGCSKYADGSSRGQQLAAQLTNTLLAARYLPGRQLGVLEGVDGIVKAAQGRLQGRQEEQLRELEHCWEGMRGKVKVRVCTVGGKGIVKWQYVCSRVKMGRPPWCAVLFPRPWE